MVVYFKDLSLGLAPQSEYSNLKWTKRDGVWSILPDEFIEKLVIVADWLEDQVAWRVQIQVLYDEMGGHCMGTLILRLSLAISLSVGVWW